MRSLLRGICRRGFAQREAIEYDVAIVGGGPAGLATAIRLKQLAKEAKKPDISVCVLEKGSAIGSHLLSGCVLEPDSLLELFPDRDFTKTPPFKYVPVTKDSMYFMLPKFAIPIPHMFHGKGMRNVGNWVMSLGEMCKWMGKEAEAAGVEIFCGFPAAELLKDKGRVVGVATSAKGIKKDGQKKDTFEEGVEIRAKATVLAEGCRGSLTKKAEEEYGWINVPQMYSLGLKEVWKVDGEKIKPGNVAHTAGFPMGINDFGGGFIYCGPDNYLSIGLIVGLCYKNPYMSPYEEFQKYKSHPLIARLLEKGQRVGYGARVLEEGGYRSLPLSCAAPGLLVVGSAAGYVDFSKIKGVHNALRSGKIAAESIFDSIQQGSLDRLHDYHTTRITNSRIYRELYETRGYPGAFLAHTFFGYACSALSSLKAGRMMMNALPFKKKHPSCENTKAAGRCKKLVYPPHNDTLTFDIDKSLVLSGVHHEYDQPSHITIAGDAKEYAEKSAKVYDKMEERFCPAKVFEFANGELKINAQNCLHCKTCTIKSHGERIEWKCPEGNGGPNYANMQFALISSTFSN